MFRKNPLSSVKCSPCTEMTEIILDNKVELNCGVEVTHHVISHRNVSDPELVKSIPTPEEYSLENRLRAGVGLDEVPTQVLTPTGVVSVNEIAEQVINVLNSKNTEE